MGMYFEEHFLNSTLLVSQRMSCLLLEQTRVFANECLREDSPLI